MVSAFMLPESEPVTQLPVYLHAESVEDNFGLSAYKVAKYVRPDALLRTGRGKLRPVWLTSTIETFVAADGGAK